MLGGLALKRRWQHGARRGGPAGRPAEPRDGHQRPGVLGEVRELLGRRDAARADGRRPLHLSAEEAVRLCDENTIGVVAMLGSTFDGSYEPVRRSAPRSTTCRRHRARRAGPRRRRLRRVRRAVSRPGPRLGLPAAAGRFDQRLGAQVRARVSGCRLDRLARRRRAPGRPDLPVNYLGDDMPTFALNFSRPGAQVVAQYYNFLRLGFDGYRRCRATRATWRPGSRARSPRSACSGCSRSGDELPVFAFALHDDDQQLHRLRRLERVA